MKKILLTVLLIGFTFLYISAQNTSQEDDKVYGFSKGNMFVSGSISFNSTSQGPIESSSFSITPQFGFFVSDNIALGPLLRYSSGKNHDLIGSDGLPINETEFNSFNLGAFGRYYFSPEKKLSFFTELGISYISNTTERTTSSRDFKSEGFNANFSPGLTYFISDAFALETSLGLLSYTSINNDGPNSQSIENFRVHMNLSNFGLGLIYKFQ